MLLACVLGLSTPPANADSPADKARLGEKLMLRQEWFRAATLFEEAALDSTGAVAQQAWIRAGDAHREANQLDKAASLYQEAASAATETADLATLRAGQSFYLAGKYAFAKRLLSPFAKRYPASLLIPEARSYRAMAALKQNDFKTASTEYAKLATLSLDPGVQKEWTQLSKDANPEAIPQKSVRAATLLSIFLPGAGQLYTEHYGEAAMAFTANAIFGVLIWDSLLKAKDMNERPHRGWAYTSTAIYGFFGSSFYFGTIYGAGVSAQRYNKLQVEKLQDSLKDRTVRLQAISIPLQ